MEINLFKRNNRFFAFVKDDSDHYKQVAESSNLDSVMNLLRRDKDLKNLEVKICSELPKELSEV